MLDSRTVPEPDRETAMRLLSLLLLSSLSTTAFGQEAECRRGAELTLER